VEKAIGQSWEEWKIEIFVKEKVKGKGPQLLPLQLQSQKVSTRSYLHIHI